AKAIRQGPATNCHNSGESESLTNPRFTAIVPASSISTANGIPGPIKLTTKDSKGRWSFESKSGTGEYSSGRNLKRRVVAPADASPATQKSKRTLLFRSSSTVERECDIHRLGYFGYFYHNSASLSKLDLSTADRPELEDEKSLFHQLRPNR